MEKTRVKSGEKYWYVKTNNTHTQIFVDWALEGMFPSTDTNRFESGNYFHTQEEAESMACKLRAVLKGAEVVEMPSEEEFEKHLNNHFPYNGGAKGIICETTKGEWRLCFKWLKSKIVK